MKLLLLHPYDIGVFHEKCIKWIEDALTFSSEMTSADVIEDLKRGDLLGYGCFDSNGNLIGFVTATIVQYPRKKVFRIVTLGGTSLEMWKELEPLIIAEAKRLTCNVFECWCRKGVAKILSDSFNCVQDYIIVSRGL